MPVRMRFAVIGLLLAGILVALAGFRRVPVTEFVAGRAVASVAIGTRPNDAGSARGIDGREYGPLTFASNGRLTVVADTYRSRLLYFTARRPVRAVPLPDAMVEDMAVSRSGHVLAADNRALSLWFLGPQGNRKVMSLPHDRGYTEALWRVGLAPGNRLLVEWVRFGRGSFSSRLDEYNDHGKLIRTLAESTLSRSGYEPLSGTSIGSPVRSFQVAPDGSIYVEPEDVNAASRVIRIYRQNGLPLGHVVIHPPGYVRRTDFLGIDGRGWIYLALNLHERHRARLLVVDSQGRTIADLKVRAVPLYAATYGRVLPSGELLLDQSTRSRYRIEVFRPVTRLVWRWRGI